TPPRTPGTPRTTRCRARRTPRAASGDGGRCAGAAPGSSGGPGSRQGARGRQGMSTAPRPRRRSRNLTAAEIQELFRRLKELDPKPPTELAYSTPFELLVAVILSAQATDVGVNKATRRLFPVANTPAQLVALGVDGLKPYISTIGLYNAKAANVVAMSQQLLDLHDGRSEEHTSELQSRENIVC